jgi:hypothetical protein
MPRDRGDVADFALSRGDNVMEDDERPERPAILRSSRKSARRRRPPIRENADIAFAGINALRQVPLRSLWPQFLGVASLHFVGFVDKKLIWRRIYAARSATDRVPS